MGRILIALDQLLNAIANGFPDETLSSRLGRARKRGGTTGDAGCVVLDAIDGDHCATSIEETASGEADPHHLGRVIRELSPEAETEALLRGNADETNRDIADAFERGKRGDE